DRPRDVWLRIARQSVERDALKSEMAGGLQFDFDTSSSRNDMAVTAGLDVLAGETDNGHWAAGLMLGYLNGDQTYGVGANSAELNGWNYGAYWGVNRGAFWWDGTLNVIELVNRQ